MCCTVLLPGWTPMTQTAQTLAYFPVYWGTWRRCQKMRDRTCYLAQSLPSPGGRSTWKCSNPSMGSTFHCNNNVSFKIKHRTWTLYTMKSESIFYLSTFVSADKLEYKRCFLASLLAHAFFSTFPKRTPKTHPTLQDFNFTLFFQHLDQWVLQKLNNLRKLN